jgi:hypothetical protein
MTQGVVFFAFNSGPIDYVRIAQWNAANVHRHLNLPVTLITDAPVDNPIFDQVILIDNAQADRRIFFDQDRLVPWRNRGRCAAYELSPYDTTLLLDVDYVVASTKLRYILEDPRDFVCHQRALEITQPSDAIETFGQHRMPMSWATVIKFNRSDLAEHIFDIMTMVQNNYSHYADLYKFRHAPFRNDYALSIALALVNGHSVDPVFDSPWLLLNVNPAHQVRQLEEDYYEIKYTKMVNNENKPFRIAVYKQDLHVMGKSFLENLIETN